MVVAQSFETAVTPHFRHKPPKILCTLCTNVPLFAVVQVGAVLYLEIQEVWFEAVLALLLDLLGGKPNFSLSFW